VQQAAPVQQAANNDPAPKKPRTRGGRGRSERNDGPIVGLGEHVPDFIARSFGDRRTG
jgi:ATP-dependent RNA helicase RhlE